AAVFEALFHRRSDPRRDADHRSGAETGRSPQVGCTGGNRRSGSRDTRSNVRLVERELVAGSLSLWTSVNSVEPERVTVRGLWGKCLCVLTPALSQREREDQR